MIVVRVELHSAISGDVVELGRMQICNTGDGTAQLGNYVGHTLIGRTRETLDRSSDRGTWQREGRAYRHPRLRLHVWHLVAKMLATMNYGR